jgi:hypothetical protein
MMRCAPFGNWAACERPLVLRARLATGLPFRFDLLPLPRRGPLVVMWYSEKFFSLARWRSRQRWPNRLFSTPSTPLSSDCTGARTLVTVGLPDGCAGVVAVVA